MRLNYAHLIMPRDGESNCGDAVMAQVFDSWALFAVIDALGHGDTAWRVAERAVAVLLRQPKEVAVETAFAELNDSLRGTRGAAATLFTLRNREADFIGVGNITCRTLGRPIDFAPRPGIVGGLRKLPKSTRVLLPPEQRLILHSDGISHRFDARLVASLLPDEACAFILRHQRHPHDDASVLVIDIRSSVEAKR